MSSSNQCKHCYLHTASLTLNIRLWGYICYLSPSQFLSLSRIHTHTHRGLCFHYFGKDLWHWHRFFLNLTFNINCACITNPFFNPKPSVRISCDSVNYYRTDLFLCIQFKVTVFLFCFSHCNDSYFLQFPLLIDFSFFFFYFFFASPSTSSSELNSIKL